MGKILITGGAGFLGSNLARTLLLRGENVIAIDNLITSTGENLLELSFFKNFVFIRFDITNPLPEYYENLLAGITEIYHLACPTGVPNLIRLGEEMIVTSAFGTRNMLDLARTTGAKLLFSSSSEVYGDCEVSPQREDYTGNVNPTGIRSPYEEGKRLAESLVELYVRKYSVDARIVRIFNTYGPRMNQHDTRVVPRFIDSVANSHPMPIEGAGAQTRTFCYVDDLINGMLAVMEKGERGEVYNLGSDEQISIRDLAKLFQKITYKKSDIAFVERPLHDHGQRLPDLRKIGGLGWKPTVDLEDGLGRTLIWYGL